MTSEAVTALEYAPLPLGFADPETPHVGTPKKARDYDVIKVYEGKTGIRWRVQHHAKGRDVQPVVVKQTRYNTFACMTCITADQCAHSATVRAYVEENGDGPRMVGGEIITDEEVT